MQFASVDQRPPGEGESGEAGMVASYNAALREGNEEGLLQLAGEAREKESMIAKQVACFATLNLSRMRLEKGDPSTALSLLGESEDQDSLVLRIRASASLGRFSRARALLKRMGDLWGKDRLHLQCEGLVQRSYFLPPPHPARPQLIERRVERKSLYVIISALHALLEDETPDSARVQFTESIHEEAQSCLEKGTEHDLVLLKKFAQKKLGKIPVLSRMRFPDGLTFLEGTRRALEDFVEACKGVSPASTFAPGKKSLTEVYFALLLHAYRQDLLPVTQINFVMEGPRRELAPRAVLLQVLKAASHYIYVDRDFSYLRHREEALRGLQARGWAGRSEDVPDDSEKEFVALVHDYIAQNSTGSGLVQFLMANPDTTFFRKGLFECECLATAFFFGDVDVACLLLFSLWEEDFVDLYAKHGPECSALVKSYIFRNGMLYSDKLDVSEKAEHFARIPSPSRSLFSYRDASLLLCISPENTHPAFFSHFIKIGALCRATYLYPEDSGAARGAQVLSPNRALERNVSLCKRYLRASCGPALYAADLYETHPAYRKAWALFMQRKEYEGAMFLRPLFSPAYLEYLTWTYAQMHSERYEKRSALPALQEICRKAACLLFLYRCTSAKSPAGAGPEVLSMAFRIHLALKHLDFPEQDREKDKGLSGAIARRLQRELPLIRAEAGVRERTSDVTRYDVWRLKFFGGREKAGRALKWCREHIGALGEVEVYLLFKALQRLPPDACEAFYGGLGESTYGKIFRDGPDQMKANYLMHLLSDEREKTDFDHAFMFHFLKNRKSYGLSDDVCDSLIDQIFYADGGDLVTRFAAWVPGRCVEYRRRYFDFLFAYLEERGEKEAIAQVKAALRSLGFLI